MRRRALALVIAVVAAMTVASATSLGSLTSISLWGTAGEKQACFVPDPSNDVLFYDDVFGLLPSLLSLVGSTVDEIEITNFDGDCVDMRPVVIVLGKPDSGSDRQVLSRTLLPALTETDATSGSVRFPVADGTELNSLLSTAVPDQVRVGFCPTGVTTCEPTP